MAKSDAIVMEMRKSLMAKKSAVLGTDNPVYKTSGLFRPHATSQRNEVNIKSSNEGEIVGALMSLNSRDAARKELGLSSGSHLGFTLEEWKDDFKTRISVINRVKTLKEIESLEAELSKLLTPKQLREIGIEELASKIENA